MNDLIELTARIVSAHVSNVATQAADLPALIADTYKAMAGLGTPAVPVKEALEPAVPVKKSVTQDFIICLEDGKKFKTLKRHLRSIGLTPEEYREKWGLPRDYPMVAPNYTAHRSKLAKAAKLGQVYHGRD